MLAWGYRKQNLVAELVSYNADIMCLQVGDAVHQTMHACLDSQCLPTMWLLDSIFCLCSRIAWLCLLLLLAM